MRVLVVDPSPLAQNLYGLLLRNCHTEVTVMTRDALSELESPDEWPALDLIVISSLLLEGGGAQYRAYLTDLPALAELPKLVIVRPGTNGRRVAWHNLPNAVELNRPFRPEEFERVVKKILR